MSRITLAVTVAVRSPFVFQGLDPAAYGYDASALRDEDRVPIIPGDHLRGHLRHALTTLAGNVTGDQAEQRYKTLLRLLFGAASPGREPEKGGEQDRPDRGLLIVGDLAAIKVTRGDIDCAAADPIGTPYPRVKIDESTGAADDAMLQQIELVAPIEAVVLFAGKIVVRPHRDLPPDVDADLRRALRLVPAMGALKSAGFGEVVHAQSDIRVAPPRPAPRIAWPAAPDRLAVTVAFDRPLLVNVRRIAGNYFAGDTVVPGGAIKGAIAEALKDAGCRTIADPGDPTGAALSDIVVSHACPLTEAGDPADRAIPDSIVAVTRPDQEPLLADLAGPRLHTDPAGDGTLPAPIDWSDPEMKALIAAGTPAFAIDWKDEVFAAAQLRLNRPGSDLHHLPRGRVAIDPATGIAEESKLFVVAPIGTRGRLWRFTLDRNSADAGTFAQVLGVLAAGLDGIGRTGARMSIVPNGIRSIPAPTLPAPRRFGTTDAFVILLETAAVLTDPDDDRPPHAQYEAAFRDLSCVPDIVLLTHFARRSLFGRYMGFRFRAFGDNRYQPFEVTEPGAVFVFTADSGGAFATWLAGIAATGLPAIRRPAAGASTGILDWRTCPFVPANGYGAITVDPVLDVASG